MDTTWMRQAACKDVAPGTMFPHTNPERMAALAICAECPVVAECLHYAIVTHQEHGIWGGQTERGRRRVRRVWTSEGRISKGTSTLLFGPF